MKNESDLRVIKTRKAIVDSFLALLAQKSFEEISVTEICRGAQCSRNTFYLHFPYKEALYDFIMDSYVEKICQCMPLFDQVPTEDMEAFYHECMSLVGRSLLSQKEVIRPLLVGEHANYFFDKITEELRETILRRTEHLHPGASQDKKYRLMCWYSASAIIGFFRGCIYDVDIPDEEAFDILGKMHSLPSVVAHTHLLESADLRQEKMNKKLQSSKSICARG